MVLIFTNFQKFKKSFEGLKPIKCKDCDKRDNCTLVEVYEDGTYQSVNSHYYYLDGYGCYKRSDKGESVAWTKDVVYKVYCNDDLNELPLGILNDMKEYIEEIIKIKLKER